MSAKKEHDFVKQVQETLQKAEHTLSKAFQEIGTRVLEAQLDAKKRVDELLHSFKKGELVDGSLDEALARVVAIRHDFELKLGEGTEALWDRLGLATKSDVQDVSKKLSALTKRVAALEPATKKPVKARAEA